MHRADRGRLRGHWKAITKRSETPRYPTFFCRVFPHLIISFWVFLHHIVFSPLGLAASSRNFIPYLSHMSCNQRGSGIRIALSCSESNLKEEGSQSIEDIGGSFVQTTDSALSPINQEEF